MAPVSSPVIPCVGAVIKDDEGRLLLIKRGHEPGAGLWSLPGGRIEPGETHIDALIRELAEETGFEVEVGHLLGIVRRPGLKGTVIDIRDYTATVVGGTLNPGDDAADVRWVDAAELSSLALTDGLVEALTSWGVLSRLERENLRLSTDERWVMSGSGRYRPNQGASSRHDAPPVPKIWSIGAAARATLSAIWSIGAAARATLSAIWCR
jgi:8-oxo-dGTP diphosphatase